MQDLAHARQRDTEGRTGHQRRDGASDDENRDGGGGGNEDEYGNEHEGRDGRESGSGNGDKNRDDNGGEKDPGNLRNGNRGGSVFSNKYFTTRRNQNDTLYLISFLTIVKYFTSCT